METGGDARAAADAAAPDDAGEDDHGIHHVVDASFRQGCDVYEAALAAIAGAVHLPLHQILKELRDWRGRSTPSSCRS